MTKPKRKITKTKNAKREVQQVHAQVALPIKRLQALRKVSGVEFLYAKRRPDGGALAFVITSASQVDGLRASGLEASVIAPINTIQDMKREVSQTNRFLPRLRQARARRKS